MKIKEIDFIDTTNVVVYYEENIPRNGEYEINNNEMPEEYRDKVMHILCNECNYKSEVPLHVIGGKCSNCNSFNTKRI